MARLAIPFLVLLRPLAWSPGPGDEVLAATGARFGVRSTVAASAGDHAALRVGALADGFGFARGGAVAATVLPAARIAGAVHVGRLAWKLARAEPLGDAPAARPLAAAGGAILPLPEPGACLVMAPVLARFPPPAAEGGATLGLPTAVIFTLNSLVAFTAWTVGGDVLLRAFRDERRAPVPNRAPSAALAGPAARMAVA
jgi:threonine/homoserine/homoserine lactone efflux protein